MHTRPFLAFLVCRPGWRLAGLLLCGALGLARCQPAAENATQARASERPAIPYVAPGTGLTGKQLAQVYCQACHRFPEPSLLDRKTWKQAVLPRMKRRLGLYEEGETRDRLVGTGPGAQQIRQAEVFPDTAALTSTQWQRITSYVLDAAPNTLAPQPERAPIRQGLSGFEVQETSLRPSVPMTSLVKIDAEAARIYVGDFGRGAATLRILDSTGRRLTSRPVGVSPSSVSLTTGSLLLADMNSQRPTDAPTGRLFRLPTTSHARFHEDEALLLSGLQRPVHAAVADLNQDGCDDIVVSEFGDKTGQLSWYECRSEAPFLQHTLKNAPGAVRSYAHDLDADGRPDVVALMGQGDEGIFAFYNEGGGRFREEPLVRFAPSYGSAYFELVDFNGDGHQDFLYANGDNADYPPIMKPYHGVRVFINDGQNNFEERFFYPLNGAYKATAADYDLDGDLDIAAISFFPDYKKSPQESFVYLESKGGLDFEASTFANSDRGRWLALDQGDVDQDGDVDLVLGAFAAFAPAYVPYELQSRWRNGPAALLLENTAR